MTDIGSRLREVARVTTDAEGQELRVIPLRSIAQLAKEVSLSLREAEISALKHHVMPARYLRNLGTVGWEGQIALLQATVGIVGAGGLGGWIVEGLARMGVGCLIVVDGEKFEENNLNRQAFCTERSLGQSKVLAARERVAEINAAVDVITHRLRANEDQMVDLLSDADVLVDALDSLPARLALQRAAQKLKVPFVHGAIAGYVGQVMTILPEDVGLPGLYASEQVPEHGIEVKWGNPAATPMMVAAWQIQEVVKLVTEHGQPLRNRLLFMDSEIGTMDILEM
jgi:molybdopterin/thiamine biosynthesis adenylyltransferase